MIVDGPLFVKKEMNKKSLYDEQNKYNICINVKGVLFLFLLQADCFVGVGGDKWRLECGDDVTMLFRKSREM